MLEQISNDIKEAMRAKDKERLDALRMLKSKLLENKTAKAPIPEPDVAISYCKKLKDSLSMFPEGSDQQTKVHSELKHLEPYLPQQLAEDEVKAMIQRIIQDQGSATLGSIMKELSPQIKGKFDGRRASELVRGSLDTK